jgi:hypothetical protein
VVDDGTCGDESGALAGIDTPLELEIQVDLISVRHATLKNIEPSKKPSSSPMRLFFIFVGSLALNISPIAAAASHPVLEKRDLPPAVQNGLTFGLSFTGIVATAIGLTEYATTLYKRYTKAKHERELHAAEIEFARKSDAAERHAADAAHDVVLNLVDKFVRKGREENRRGNERIQKEEGAQLELTNTVLLKVDGIEGNEDGEIAPLPKLSAFSPGSRSQIRPSQAGTALGDIVASSDQEEETGLDGYEPDISDDEEQADAEDDVHPICRGRKLRRNVPAQI